MQLKSTIFLSCVTVLAVGGLLLIVIHPHTVSRRYHEGLSARKQLVRELGLTDLCLFTEARYTRHLSQADLHSAFQSHPMALEHFPSGSIAPPPDRFGPPESLGTER